VARAAVNSARYMVPVDGFSHAVAASSVTGLLFVSGLTSRASDGSIVSVGDVGGQMRQILRQLAAILGERSLTLDDVVQIRTFATDIESWSAIEEAFREAWGTVWPASTFVEVARLYDRRQLVEMEAVAVLEEGGR
jgi:2-iminobutanoate/2-iminopropanoate deaminase